MVTGHLCTGPFSFILTAFIDDVIDLNPTIMLELSSPPGLTYLLVPSSRKGMSVLKRRRIAQIKELVVELTSLALLLIAAVKLILHELAK